MLWCHIWWSKVLVFWKFHQNYLFHKILYKIPLFEQDMAASVVPKRHRARNTSKMWDCCFHGACFNNFKDLPERIGDIKGDALFEFLHESPSGHMISYVPKGYKWSEFLFDFWDFTSQQDFKDEFTTSLCVNHNGHSKIYCNWRVLDWYKVK